MNCGGDRKRWHEMPSTMKPSQGQIPTLSRSRIPTLAEVESKSSKKEGTLNDTTMSFSHFNFTSSDFRWRQLLVDFLPHTLAVPSNQLLSSMFGWSATPSELSWPGTPMLLCCDGRAGLSKQVVML